MPFNHTIFLTFNRFLRNYVLISLFFITFAGTPPATTPDPMLLLTTAFAPIMLLSPIITPGKTITLVPTQTFPI